MKDYNAPTLECIELKAEESIATYGSSCGDSVGTTSDTDFKCFW